MNGSTIGAVTVDTTLADATYDVPVSKLIETPLYINCSPLGDNARIFTSYLATASVAAWINPGWQIPVISVLGGTASTVCLQVQCYYNLEFIADDGAAITRFAREPPPNNPLAQDVSAKTLSKVGNFIEGSAKKIDAVYNSTAFKILSSVAAGVMTRSPSTALAVYGSQTSSRRIRDVD